MREANKLLSKLGQVKTIDEAEDEIEEVPISKPSASSFSLDDMEAKQRIRETKKALKQIAREQKIESAQPEVTSAALSPRKNRAYAVKLKLPPAETRKPDHPKVAKSKEHPFTSLFRYYMALDEKDVNDPDVTRSRILNTLIFLCFV